MRPDHEGPIVCPKIAYHITALGMTCRRPLTNQTSEQRAEGFPASAEPGRSKAGVGELLSGGTGISSRASQASGLPSPPPLSMKARNMSVSKPGELGILQKSPIRCCINLQISLLPFNHGDTTASSPPGLWF